MRRSIVALCSVALLLGAWPPGVLGAAPSVTGATAPLTARNVILMIDDGAGYNHHLAGSLYDKGQPGAEAYNAFPVQVAVATYSYGDVPVNGCEGGVVGYDPALAWSQFWYVLGDPTDSAAAATAMATGVKTYDSAIGVDCGRHAEANIVEIVESLGKSSGVVTSVPFSHATPAAFVAHDVARDDYLGIAHQMIATSAVDVIMGGGHPYFSRVGQASKKPGWTWVGSADWAALTAGTAGADANGDGVTDPWTLVQTREEFQALMTGETPQRVLGLAQVRRTLQADRGGDAYAAPFEVPFIETVPTLSEMAAGALNVLDADPDGFFLMVEGGATDWASHDNQPGRMIEEEVAFDRSVDTVTAWVDQHSSWDETLVVVVSDHETGYLTGLGSQSSADGPLWLPVSGKGAGVTPGLQFNSGTHTNSLVPLYAKGAAAQVFRDAVSGFDPHRGYFLDNTDIHRLIEQVMTAPAT